MKRTKLPYLLGVTSYFEFRTEREAEEFGEKLRQCSVTDHYELAIYKRKPRRKKPDKDPTP